MSHTIRSFAAMLMVAATTVFAKTATFNGEGNAVLRAGDRGEAKQQAQVMAETNAVADAVKSVGGAPEDAERLLAKSRSFIKSSEVVDDETDTTYVTVKVAVVVDIDVLKPMVKATASTSLGVQTHKVGRRVLILATEQLGPREVIAWTDYAFAVGPNNVSASAKTKAMVLLNDMGGLDATIAAAFTDSGFDVIDPKVLSGKIAPRKAFEVVDLSAPQAETIAKAADADLVVIVQGNANLAHNNVIAQSGMYSGSGNVIAKAIRVKDGKVLASSTQQAAKLHIDLNAARIAALNDAAKLASADILKKISAE